MNEREEREREDLFTLLNEVTPRQNFKVQRI
jgi:hypothetical protein